MNYKQENVIDYQGKSIPKKNAKKFIINKNPVWFEKGVTCFELEDLIDPLKTRWVNILNPNLAYLVLENQYVWKAKVPLDYTKGIYNYKEDIGYFPYDYKTTVLLKKHHGSGTTFCISKEVALQLGYDEFYFDGIYYKRENLSAEEINYLKQNRINKTNFEYYDKSLFQATSNQYYNATKSVIYKKVVESYNNNNLNITAEDKLLASFIPYSLGLEFETSNGKVPERYIYDLGLIPLKDGSITNYEYTTIPLSGAKGISTIKSICEELTNRCTLDYKCSFHLHLGGLNVTMANTVAAYKLFYYIQDELLSLFPLYKQEDFKITEKNYCKLLLGYPLLFGKLDLIDKFNVILGFLNTLNNDSFTLNTKAYVDKNFTDSKITNLHHYIDPGNNAKWNVYSRYFLVNLNPFIYGPSTIENRLHTPTTNQTKILCWILINTAILNYISDNQVDLVNADFNYKLTLNQIISEGFKNNNHPCKNDLVKYLQSYIEFRKKEMKLAIDKNNIYADEITKDKDYKFETNNNMFDLIINKIKSYVTA